MMVVSLVTLKKILLAKLVLASKRLTMIIPILNKIENNNVKIIKIAIHINLVENGQVFTTYYIKTLGETFL